MFFMIGTYPKEEILPYEYDRLTIHSCGSYNRITIIMRYYVFSLFLIPLFKFNKTYYAKFSCCNRIYEIDKSIGKQIESGENPPLDVSNYETYDKYQEINICPYCNREMEEDFEYCPYCGKKL